MRVGPTRDRFHAAAVGYLVYGAVYWVGGLYLLAQGIGVAGGRTGDTGASMVKWGLLGLVPLIVVPLVLWRRWSWFERWILNRRDFARMIALLMAVRALALLLVALTPEAATVTAPWGGEVSFRLGAAVFFAVTAVALVLVVRAAWSQRLA